MNKRNCVFDAARGEKSCDDEMPLKGRNQRDAAVQRACSEGHLARRSMPMVTSILCGVLAAMSAGYLIHGFRKEAALSRAELAEMQGLLAISERTALAAVTRSSSCCESPAMGSKGIDVDPRNSCRRHELQSDHDDPSSSEPALELHPLFTNPVGVVRGAVPQETLDALRKLVMEESSAEKAWSMEWNEKVCPFSIGCGNHYAVSGVGC